MLYCIVCIHIFYLPITIHVTGIARNNANKIVQATEMINKSYSCFIYTCSIKLSYQEIAPESRCRGRVRAMVFSKSNYHTIRTNPVPAKMHRCGN